MKTSFKTLPAAIKAAQIMADRTGEITHVVFNPGDDHLYELFTDKALYHLFEDTLNADIEYTVEPTPPTLPEDSLLEQISFI